MEATAIEFIFVLLADPHLLRDLLSAEHSTLGILTRVLNQIVFGGRIGTVSVVFGNFQRNSERMAF